MRQSSGLVSSRLLRNIDHLFLCTATIQQPAEGHADTGQMLPAWADVPGLVDLPCRIQPTRGQEHRLIDHTYAELSHRIALRGSFAGITPKHRVVVEDVVYDIETVEQDSQRLLTYLGVNVVR